MAITKLNFGFLSAGLFVFAFLATPSWLTAQSASPSPATSEPSGDYSVTSSFEIGLRGIEVNGNHEKYRSDLNYKAGVRLFDSSLVIEDHTTKTKLFDRAFFSVSGWGADPSGSFRLNMDRTGIFKLDSNIRRVKYYNNLSNHAPGQWSVVTPTESQHRFNTEHYFGDFDVVVRPESENFRLKLGYSFNDTEGPGAYNIRFRSDEYGVDTLWQSDSHEFRVGTEGKLLGFNLGLNYGHRIFEDRTRYFLNRFSPGNNPLPPPGSSELYEASRRYINDGTVDWVSFNVQRTFARKLDFTGRFIYAESNVDTGEDDLYRGRSNSSGDLILFNQIEVPGEVKRPQTRADIGLTYRITNDFRISNTFNFDQFGIGGSNQFSELVISTTFGGTPRPNSFSDALNSRGTAFRRFTNVVEADYQVRNWLSLNAGYRYTHREVTLWGLTRNNLTGVFSGAVADEHQNTTHSLIAGARIKPSNNWTIFADVEGGQSDSVFTRLGNNDFLNFRVRSVASIRQFAFNLSFITKDNDNPGTSRPVTSSGGFPATETIATAKTRIFSGSIDWTPRQEFSLSAGYTYNHQTARTDIILPVGVPAFPTTRWLLGSSEYYMRDSYFFFDVSAKPIDRVSIFASYRINDDNGQGDRIQTRPEDIITSYPMRFQSPEIRLAIKLTRNIDWNVGYQYFDYRETPVFHPFSFSLISQGPNVFVPQRFDAQNYNAHLPYTSLRIYLGRRAADR